MTIATITMTICDLCGSSEGTQAWNLHGPERSYLTELCDEHGGAFVEAVRPFISDIAAPLPKKTGELTPDFRERIRTLEEIEASK